MISNKTIRAMLKTLKYQKINMNVYNLPLNIHDNLNDTTFPLWKNGLEELKNTIQVVDSNRENQWSFKDVKGQNTMEIINDGDKGILIKVTGKVVNIKCHCEYHNLINGIDRAIGDRDHNRKLFDLLYKEKRFSIVKESFYSGSEPDIDYILDIGKSNGEYWTNGSHYVLVGDDTKGSSYSFKSGKATNRNQDQEEHDSMTSRWIRLDVLCKMLGTSINKLIFDNHRAMVANMQGKLSDGCDPHINHAFPTSIQTSEMLKIISKAIA